jgi:hypothetical protein
MTPQEIFDKSVEHLLGQNEAALTNGVCRYRASSGLACAVGCFMTDDEYAVITEGGDAERACEQIKEATERYPAWGNTSWKRQLLAALQDVHDDNDPREWPEALRRTAKMYGLSERVLDEHTANRSS